MTEVPVGQTFDRVRMAELGLEEDKFTGTSGRFGYVLQIVDQLPPANEQQDYVVYGVRNGGGMWIKPNIEVAGVGTGGNTGIFPGGKVIVGGDQNATNISIVTLTDGSGNELARWQTYLTDPVGAANQGDFDLYIVDSSGTPTGARLRWTPTDLKLLDVGPVEDSGSVINQGRGDVLYWRRDEGQLVTEHSPPLAPFRFLIEKDGYPWFGTVTDVFEGLTPLGDQRYFNVSDAVDPGQLAQPMQLTDLLVIERADFPYMATFGDFHKLRLEDATTGGVESSNVFTVNFASHHLGVYTFDAAANCTLAQPANPVPGTVCDILMNRTATDVTLGITTGAVTYTWGSEKTTADLTTAATLVRIRLECLSATKVLVYLVESAGDVT